MRKQTLGQGLEVSAVGLGCMGMSHANGAPMDERDAVRLLREAYEVGYTYFDTAETYGFAEDPHHNEKLLGEAFQGMRDKVVISSKFGVAFDYAGNPERPPLVMDSRPEVIRASIEGTLTRLRTDYLDLYFQHRVDPNVPVEEVAAVMADLIAEGKIGHWGISMVDEATLRRAHAICRVTAVQNMYHLLNADDSLFATLDELGIGFVSACPLAKGLFSGKYQKGQTFEKGDFRGFVSWFSDESFDRNQALFDLLSDIAEEHGATPAQVSLAWMICKRPWMVPIAGTRKSERLRENAGAGDLILSPEELARIDALATVPER